MGIFNRFPYSSTHEMNLDFMLGKAQEINEQLQTVQTGMQEVQTGLSQISEQTERATTAAAAAEAARDESQQNERDAFAWTEQAEQHADRAEAALSQMTDDADRAEAAADRAEAAAQNASISASAASNSANIASQNSATAAQQAANAELAAQNAANALNRATVSANNAQNSAVSAADAAALASGYNSQAATSATNAATSATNAAASATSVIGIEQNVQDLVDSIPEDYTTLSNDVDGLKSALTRTDTVKIDKRYVGKAWNEFAYPDGYLGTFKPVRLFTDGLMWKTSYNKQDYKNSGGVTRYVKPDGSWRQDGLSRENATGLKYALQAAGNGDTIILTEGDYRRDNAESGGIPTINKSINLIGEGNCRSVVGLKMTPTLESNGLYKFYTGNIRRIFDDEYGFEFKKVRSEAECLAEKNTLWLSDNNTGYINTDTVKPYLVLVDTVGFIIDSTASDVNVYFENIEMIGGNTVLITNTSNAYHLSIVCDNCKFKANTDQAQSLVMITGGTAIFNDCEASLSYNDGFQYTKTPSGEVGGFLEIGCVAHDNGFMTADDANGSTTHSGICGTRVNGIYFSNKGGNVADVHTGTHTVNCGCLAYDSRADAPNYSQGFGLQQASAKMWLYNCIAFGNVYDFYGVPSTEIVAEKCYHGTDNYNFDYSGTLTNTDPKTMEYYNTIKSAFIAQQLLG